MKKTSLILLITILFFGSCSQKTVNNESRQFEKKISINALLKDDREVTLQARYFYVLRSDNEKLFDKKGYLIDPEKTSGLLIEPTVKAAFSMLLREVTYDEYLAMEPQALERKLLDYAQNMQLVSDSALDVRFRINAILLDSDLK